MRPTDAKAPFLLTWLFAHESSERTKHVGGNVTKTHTDRPTDRPTQGRTTEDGDDDNGNAQNRMDSPKHRVKVAAVLPQQLLTGFAALQEKKVKDATMIHGVSQLCVVNLIKFTCACVHIFRANLKTPNVIGRVNLVANEFYIFARDDSA